MHVHVKLSTTLRTAVPGYNPAQGLRIELDNSACVYDLAERLQLPVQEIAIIMVNGRRSEMGHALEDNDQVAFFPAVGGG